MVKPVVKKEVGQVTWQSTSGLLVEEPDRSDEDEVAPITDGGESASIAPATTDCVASESASQTGREGTLMEKQDIALAESENVMKESQERQRGKKRLMSAKKVAQQTSSAITREIKRLRKESAKSRQ